MTPPPLPKGLHNPFETPLPDKDNDMYPDDEVSEVKDFGGMFKKMAKFDESMNKLHRAVDRMVDPILQIPEIRDKVDIIGERVTRVEEQIKPLKEKIGELNGYTKKPHDCFQVDNIERIEVATMSIRKDREDDTKKIVLIASDVTDIKDNMKGVKEVKRSSFTFWVGTLAGLLVVIFTSIWYMRGVSAEIQMEAQARDFQFKQVEQVLNKVSAQSDPAPMVQQIKQLKNSVDQNSAADIEDWCSRLNENDIQKMKAILPRQSWPNCSKLR